MKAISMPTSGTVQPDVPNRVHIMAVRPAIVAAFSRTTSRRRRNMLRGVVVTISGRDEDSLASLAQFAMSLYIE